MTNDQLTKIFQRYLENRCTADDIKTLVHYFDTDQESHLRALILEEIQKPVPIADEPHLTEKTKSVYDLIAQQIATEKDSRPKPTILGFRRWKPFVVAASLLLCLGLGLYYLTSESRPAAVRLSELKPEQDIAPGSDRAVLMLSDGSTIDLRSNPGGIIMAADGIHYQDDQTMDIVALSAGNLTLSTPRGGQYKIELSDGSKVWLNAGSTLTYPSQFNGAQRTVSLVGEAYFEVAKNAKQPFVVNSPTQTVTVLGTHFNVRDYPEENDTKTALIEGSVRVEQLHSTSSQVLRPNQQARIRKGAGEIYVSSVDTEAATDWKQGDFVFKGEDLKTAMQKIARWYDVEIVYDGPIRDEVQLGGWITRDNKLSKVLEWIESTSDIRFKLEGRRVHVGN